VWGESGLKNTEHMFYKQGRKILFSAHSDTMDEDSEDEDEELVEPLSNF
jgi:hypothetical protein